LTLQRYGELRAFDRQEAQEAVFEYFASQIVDSASEETRRVLIHTALFPLVTAAACG
jgi:hypothetical protein